RNDIHNGYLKVTRELDNTMTHTANVLSQLTNYTSVVMAPRFSALNCKHVQIVPLIKDRALMIIVTHEGIAKNVELTLSSEVDTNLSLKLSNVLNSFLKNISLKEMNGDLIDHIQELSPEESKLLHEILPVLRDTLVGQASEIHATGLTNLFNYPEFSDVDRIKHLVNIIEEKPMLADVFSNNDGSQIIRVSIGEENDNENLKELSIITTTYELDGNIMGAFGVIGPTRMNYDNVSSVLNYIRNELNTNLSKLLMK
ncbi:MAG: HrcA family transcriptional regulator, partial [Carnobacterium sp.]